MLEGITRTLQDLPSDQAFEAKHQLTAQSLRLKHGHVAKAITPAQNIPFVTDKNGEIASSILLYTMDTISSIFSHIKNLCHMVIIRMRIATNL